MSHKLTPFYLPLVSDNPRVYISGPMSGMEDGNNLAFARAAEQLRHKGFSVCNPVETSAILGNLSHAEFLRFDFARILEADWLLALDGFADSPGARVEILMALSMGLGVWTEANVKVLLGESRFSFS